MPPKRPLSPSSSSSKLASSPLYVSKPIDDRSSTFTAYFSPTVPQRQLQSHPDLTTASHRILAWRKPSSSQKTLTGFPTYNSGFDDDGETYAGKKLMKLLDDYKVDGSIVVARWYGGTMLGPVRFQHVENAAREAIRAYLADKNGETNASSPGETAKKVKVLEGEDNMKLKEEMVEELKRRDESITMLRGLLDEKMGKTKKGGETEKKGEGEGSGMLKVAKEVDYGSMPLVRLQQIEKARDNTIAYLLKKIDEVEAQQASLDRLDSEKDHTKNEEASKA
ncbi:hypothetical protein ABW20_dc0109319 [Dactylellina cionopaga]|nr:hypothetical protein ABW20_dc0109319 [Dactylellina cionopaga]